MVCAMPLCVGSDEIRNKLTHGMIIGTQRARADMTSTGLMKDSTEKYLLAILKMDDPIIIATYKRKEEGNKDQEKCRVSILGP